MVEFNLPKNSRVGEGKTHAAPPGAKNLRTFKVYRWNPDDGKNPQVDSYQVDLGACGPDTGRQVQRVANPVAPRASGHGKIENAFVHESRDVEGLAGSAAHAQVFASFPDLPYDMFECAHGDAKNTGNEADGDLDGIPAWVVVIAMGNDACLARDQDRGKQNDHKTDSTLQNNHVGHQEQHGAVGPTIRRAGRSPSR